MNNLVVKIHPLSTSFTIVDASITNDENTFSLTTDLNLNYDQVYWLVYAEFDESVKERHHYEKLFDNKLDAETLRGKMMETWGSSYKMNKHIFDKGSKVSKPINPGTPVRFKYAPLKIKP